LLIPLSQTSSFGAEYVDRVRNCVHRIRRRKKQIFESNFNIPGYNTVWLPDCPLSVCRKWKQLISD